MLNKQTSECEACGNHVKEPYMENWCRESCFKYSRLQEEYAGNYEMHLDPTALYDQLQTMRAAIISAGLELQEHGFENTEDQQVVDEVRAILFEALPESKELPNDR
jgi:hypothetical protein